jgi:hypothetical protein
MVFLPWKAFIDTIWVEYGIVKMIFAKICIFSENKGIFMRWLAAN